MALKKQDSDQGFLTVSNLTHSYVQDKGESFTAIQDVKMSIKNGEFVSLVGPSGCGKSSLFNIIAGLIDPDEGSVIMDGSDVTGTTGHVGYMLQRDLLLPWRSVLDNVILGQEIQGIPRKQARQEARVFLDKFGLGSFADKFPDTLSGGMRQRAAFIRTILFKKDIFLLDEPLGALDAQTRILMQEWLLEVWEEFKKTVLFITHDIEEAVFLSDRVYVMSARPGRILAEININLPRPREISIRTDPTYMKLKAEIMDLIRSESLKALDGPGR